MSEIKLPIISIIIPTYNYAHTLERAVLSAYNQLGKNCELIIINDGSTDNTSELLVNLSEKYSSLAVINKSNGGLASTRNEGIRRAKGDYFIFLDADDELQPNAISNIRNHLELNPDSKFIIGGHYSISPKGKKKLHLPASLPVTAYGKLKSYLIDKTISISNGACVMHKTIFSQYSYPEHFRNSEDLSMFAYTLVNFTCSTLNLPLANIYKHDDSLRHNVNHAENVGMQLVDEVFNPKRIPNDLQVLKKDFLVQRLLSLSRVCHEANRHPQCTYFFLQAYKANKRVIFNWSYFKKYILSLSKITFKI